MKQTTQPLGAAPPRHAGVRLAPPALGLPSRWSPAHTPARSLYSRAEQLVAGDVSPEVPRMDTRGHAAAVALPVLPGFVWLLFLHKMTLAELVKGCTVPKKKTKTLFWNFKTAKTILS